MMFFGAFALVFVGLYVLNWFAVVFLTGAMGLRRRRWGTPGGGWALVSAALNGVVGVGVVGVMGGLSWIGPGSEELAVLILLGVAVLLLAWVGSHAALGMALHRAWEAADAAEADAARTAHPIGATS